MNRADTAPRIRIQTELVQSHTCACLAKALFESVRGEDPQQIRAEFEEWLANRKNRQDTKGA